MVNRFIKAIHLKKGSLRRALHVPINKKIAVGELRVIKNAKAGQTVYYHGKPIHVTRKLERKSIFALTLRKLRH